MNKTSIKFPSKLWTMVYGLWTALILFSLHPITAYAELVTNQAADVVVGQRDFNSSAANQGGSVKANALYGPHGVYSDGRKLFIADYDNNRVLIYNTIPTSNNASADVVIGQPNFTSNSANQGGSVKANTLRGPMIVCSDGQRLFIADRSNNRVLIYNTIPTSNNASADVVVGQADFTHNAINQTGNTNVAGQNTLYSPTIPFSDGTKLFINDGKNNRVLIYNTIPTSNNAAADVVIGQPDFTSNLVNQGGGPAANTLYLPYAGLFSDGKRLFINDADNSRVLIYNSIPTSNNAPADVVIGQANFTSNSTDQGGNVAANTLNIARGLYSDGKRLFIADHTNNRVLIYNLGTSIQLGPQFEQGKAVLGKVFNDKNGNGEQDEAEAGIEGVKVASDTGIYAITDADGKYHYPYIETGQRLLKIDLVTLPEGATFTTDNPARVIVTKGILSKVSFGVKLPQITPQEREAVMTSQLNNEPLLKVSITQDPVLLKPRLAVTTTQDKENITFNIDCNYWLFLEKSKLIIYNQDYQPLKEIELLKPLPSKYTLPLSELPAKSATYYYQLFVSDRQGREDRTGVGRFEVGK